MKRDRLACDDGLIAWADAVTDDWLAGDLIWRSSLMQSDMIKPKWLVVSHIFNHQTHHRGQIHAMLTAAGAKPKDTDLILMEQITT